MGSRRVLAGPSKRNISPTTFPGFQVMKRFQSWRLSIVSVLLLGLVIAGSLGGRAAFSGAETPPKPEQRAKAEKLMADGNWKDAYKEFRELCLNAKNDPKLVGRDLNNGVNCLRNLGRIAEFDEF